MVTFVVLPGVKSSTLREIGDHLRRYGSGRHWIERYRGDVFIHPGDGKDVGILADEYSDAVRLRGEDDNSGKA